MYSTLYNTWIKYRIVTFNFEKLQRKPFITNRIDARQDKGVHVITKRTLNVLGKPCFHCLGIVLPVLSTQPIYIKCYKKNNNYYYIINNNNINNIDLLLYLAFPRDCR
jgi:hypothetical protein